MYSFHWRRVFFITKPGKEFQREVSHALNHLWSLNLEVVVEPKLYDQLKRDSSMSHLFSSTRTINGTEVESEPLISFSSSDFKIDFIITFGGDGLLLYVNTLFAGRNIPPAMCFDFGSLGFLSPFCFSNFEDEVN